MRIPTWGGSSHHFMQVVYWIRKRSKKIINDLVPGRPSVELGGHVSWRAKIEGTARNIRVSAGAGVREHAWLACLDEKSSIEIGGGTVINPYAKLLAADGGSIKIGRNCSVHSFDVFYGFSGGLTIGDYVRVAVNVIIVSSDYQFDDPARPIHGQGSTSLGISIGDYVWIGAGAIIVDGVKIGANSVIGAGCVVTKDVPENSVCVGVPGRCIRRRGQKLPREMFSPTPV